MPALPEGTVILMSLFDRAHPPDIARRIVNLPQPEAVRRRVLSSDDLVRLATELGMAYAPMVYLGAVLGFRWGEVAGLRVGRVDFLRSTVTVAEQITRGARGGNVVGPPKSRAGRRTLAMPPTLRTMLEEHMTRGGLTGSDADAFMFVARDGDPLRYDPWRRRVWDPACVRSGLAGVTFHDLRRTNATALVADGIDLKTAQTRLGHTDARLTLGLYAQATTDGDRAAAFALEQRFFSEPSDARAINAP